MILKFEDPLRTVIFMVILILASSLYLSYTSSARFGFYNDDSLYVTAAKALVTGQGYRFIGLPFDLPQTKYPIFYPFLLSIIWAVFPQFPANLVPMMLFSVLATVAFLIVAYLYLRDRNYAGPGQALLIILLVAVNPTLMILSSSLLSDMLYAAISLAGLWMVERLKSSRHAGWLTVGAGVTLGLAFLTRSIASALLAAVIAYLTINREFKKALIISITAGCFILPWIVWCHLQAGKTGPLPSFLTFYSDYTSFFRAVVGELGMLKIVAKDVLLLVYFIPLTCLAIGTETIVAMASLGEIFLYLNFFVLAGGFIRHVRSEIRLAHLYVAGYILLLAVWPFPGTYERFLVPILPLLLLYLTTELLRIMNLIRATLATSGKQQTIGGFLNKIVAAVFLLVLAGWLVTIVYYSLRADLQALSTKAAYVGRAQREEKIFEWIRAHTNRSDVLICYRDQVYYLFTDRKAIRPIVISDMLKDLYTNQTRYPLRQEEHLFHIIKACQARYLIIDPDDFNLESSPELLREKLRETIAKWPQVFVPVYRGAASTTIYRIDSDNRYSESRGLQVVTASRGIH